MRPIIIPCLLLLCGVVTSSDVMERAAPTSDPAAVAHLTAVADALMSNVTSLLSQTHDLRVNLGHKGTELSNTYHVFWNQSSLVTNISRELNTRQHQLDHLDSYIKSHVNTMNTHVAGMEQGVGFTVCFRDDVLGRNQTTTVGRWQYLKFDYVVSQIGGQNYNTSTGFFVALSAGTYAFYLNMERNNPLENNCVEASIIRNTNNWLADVAACPSGFAASANMAVAFLSKGDRVRVQSMNSERINGYTHTTFSGFKISPHF